MKTLLLLLLMIFIGNIFEPTVHAEIKIYEGVGEFEFSEESLEYAKKQAKFKAMREISEQIYLQIKSRSQVKNNVLEHNEIVAITQSLMKITKVSYSLLPSEKNHIIAAIVEAEIDTEEIEKLISERKSE